MGSVYRARDPKLDREVAVKLLHHHGTSPQRLLREARAVARIQHPNVVAVHDVGEYEDGRGHVGVFMVMELVRGQDLRAWLADGHREADAVLECFLGAGRGLAAAHAADIIHRDFKPANVLLDEDGRPMVSDFGLAQGTAEPRTEPTAAEPGEEDGSLPLSAPLTAVGTVLGTPRYMSPEQHRGDPLGPKTDQFSFCVALVEALQRRPPFDGQGRALYRNKEAGRVDVSGLDLDAIKVRALLRGMAANPEERWPSMDALLSALRRRPRRFQWVAAGLAALGIGGAAYAASQPDPIDCAAQAEYAAEVWNPERRTAVDRVLVDPARPGSEVAAAHVRGVLDRAAEGMNTVSVQACEAAPSDGSEPVLACLERHRDRLGAIVERIAQGDDAARQYSADLVALLPPPGECAEASSRGADAAVSDPRLFEVQLALAAHDHALAKSIVDPWLEDATGPARADALLLRARLDYTTLSLDEVLASSSEALALAEAAGRDGLAADALVVRAMSLKDGPAAQLAEARRTLELARAKAERLPSGPGRYAVAIANTDAAICLREAYQREVPPKTCAEKAMRAVELAPEDTPGLAKTLNQATEAHRMAGNLEDAAAVGERSLQLHRRIYGPHHPALVITHRTLARIASTRGDIDAALDHLDHAVRLSSPPIATTAAAGFAPRFERAGLRSKRGDHEGALADYEACLPVAPPQYRGAVQEVTAFTLFLLGRHADALEAVDAVETDADVSPENRSTDTLTLRAEILVALERLDEALTSVEQALAAIPAEGTSPVTRAQTLLVHVRVLRLGGDEKRARTQLEQAKRAVEEAERPELGNRLRLEEAMVERDPAALATAIEALAEDPQSAMLVREAKAMADALSG